MTKKLLRFRHLLVASQALVWLPALAQNSLTVPMEIVRISNPDLSAESRGNVTLFRIHPQYTLQKTQDSSRTELSLGCLIERSSNVDLSANRTLPSVRFLWEDSSPVSVFGLRASIEEASTRETEFAEFGRVTLDAKSRTATLGGSWTHNLSQVSSVQLAASHARVSYDRPSFVDYSETLGSVAYHFQPSAGARYSLFTSASRLNPDGGRENASRGEVSIGYEREVSEGVVLNASLGVVRTNALLTDTDPVGRVRIAYTGERIGYAMAWSREVSVGGTLEGYTRSENFDASLTYPVTIDMSLDIGLTHAKSLEADGEAGASVFVRVRSALSRYWTLTAGLEQRRSMPPSGPSAHGGWLAVGLTYAHPDF